MIEALLIAQLSGPRCGWYPGGTVLTPENTPFTGCTVPGPDQYGTRLRADPFSPSGVRAEPAGPPPLPNQIKYGIPYQ
jgi:hypothetical protein